MPPAYQQAIFAMHLASKFYYENGAEANSLKFYQYMKVYEKQLENK